MFLRGIRIHMQSLTVGRTGGPGHAAFQRGNEVLGGLMRLSLGGTRIGTRYVARDAFQLVVLRASMAEGKNQPRIGPTAE